ncbi:MAG: hypothetical protein KJ915_00615 [Candidatus Omnitrophica bacterium]|nr:hypothetical protein [Candidatus Omnitrophota bacterium]
MKKIILIIYTIILLLNGGLLMAESGYRALPLQINSPANAKLLTSEEFNKIKKIKIETGGSLCKGHKGTVVWYNEKIGYILEIQLEQKAIYALSICTFTPTQGMDKIDGMFAQDIEDYILSKELDYYSERLKIFKEQKSIDIDTYLNDRGIKTNH